MADEEDKTFVLYKARQKSVLSVGNPSPGFIEGTEVLTTKVLLHGSQAMYPVLICDPFEWYGLERRDELPSIVVGKYLKLVYESHSRHATLDLVDLNHDGKLDIYDLGAVFKQASA